MQSNRKDRANLIRSGLTKLFPNLSVYVEENATLRRVEVFIGPEGGPFDAFFISDECTDADMALLLPERCDEIERRWPAPFVMENV